MVRIFSNFVCVCVCWKKPRRQLGNGNSRTAHRVQPFCWPIFILRPEKMRPNESEEKKTQRKWRHFLFFSVSFGRVVVVVLDVSIALAGRISGRGTADLKPTQRRRRTEKKERNENDKRIRKRRRGFSCPLLEWRRFAGKRSVFFCCWNFSPAFGVGGLDGVVVVCVETKVFFWVVSTWHDGTTRFRHDSLAGDFDWVPNFSSACLPGFTGFFFLNVTEVFTRWHPSFSRYRVLPSFFFWGGGGLCGGFGFHWIHCNPFSHSCASFYRFFFRLSIVLRIVTVASISRQPLPVFGAAIDGVVVGCACLLNWPSRVTFTGFCCCCWVSCWNFGPARFLCCCWAPPAAIRSVRGPLSSLPSAEFFWLLLFIFFGACGLFRRLAHDRVPLARRLVAGARVEPVGRTMRRRSSIDRSNDADGIALAIRRFESSPTAAWLAFVFCFVFFFWIELDRSVTRLDRVFAPLLLPLYLVFLFRFAEFSRVWLGLTVVDWGFFYLALLGFSGSYWVLLVFTLLY